MPLLLYCITEACPAANTTQAGVFGRTVSTVDESGLRCFVSEIPDAINLSREAKQAAVAFNRVLQDLLQKTAVIPFRFPTVLQDNDKVAVLLREHAAESKRSLSWLENMVQMELLIGFSNGNVVGKSDSRSGADYLRSRQERYHSLATVAAELTADLAHHMKSSRQRTSPSGARIYALVPRSSVQEFRQRAAQLKIPATLTARVTGPWPATEFLEDN